ncbi:MAG: hypothetical protein DI586_04285 [Micavibrio aeruginosavorus]|uniref:Uncharacterized protein n=1 Tax=Micavibrio aeruginosavorus TaxID=349221 RepID=A0A2W5FPD0_9BACT|nr:MAG: hypothetical protein DI586_04285 [Micavibrio aeruginosavorus]
MIRFIGRQRMANVMICAIILVPTIAHADDTQALLQRIEALEAQQKAAEKKAQFDAITEERDRAQARIWDSIERDEIDRKIKSQERDIESLEFYDR